MIDGEPVEKVLCHAPLVSSSEVAKTFDNGYADETLGEFRYPKSESG